MFIEKKFCLLDVVYVYWMQFMFIACCLCLLDVVYVYWM